MTLFRFRKDLPVTRDVANHTELQRSINDLFDSFWGDWPTARLAQERGWGKDFVPSLDLKENKDSFEVHADLPGVRREDISLELKDNALYLTGEKKFENTEDKEGWHRIERSYGSFSRVIPFSAEVDEEKVNAKFQDGVLKVTVAKARDEERKTRKITIG